MESVTRKVKDIGSADRRILENVIGQPLAENQQIVFNVVDIDDSMPPQHSPMQSVRTDQDVPQWWKVYEGLDKAEVDRLDAAIRQRANLTRSFD